MMEEVCKLSNILKAVTLTHDDDELYDHEVIELLKEEIDEDTETPVE
jgi:hypothetical protein